MTQTRPPHIELDQAYGQLRTALQAYLQRQVGDVGTAEDLVQDVFVKALRAVKEDRAPRDLTAWLYQAARTTLIDYWRTRKPGSDIDPMNCRRAKTTTLLGCIERWRPACDP